MLYLPDGKNENEINLQQDVHKPGIGCRLEWQEEMRAISTRSYFMGSGWAIEKAGNAMMPATGAKGVEVIHRKEGMLAFKE